MGDGMVITDQPSLIQHNSGALAIISNGHTALFFDPEGAEYSPRGFLQHELGHNSSASEYVFTDSKGAQIRFHDFTVTPQAKRGQIKRYTDPSGSNQILHTYAPTTGKLSD